MIPRKHPNIPDEELETITLARVQEQAARLLEDSRDRSLEQHLLVCSACVESLAAIEVQLAVLKDALKRSRQECRTSLLRRRGTQ